MLHYAFGSSDVFADPAKGRSAPALPRLIRVNELSNSSITAEELEAYRRRVFDQARSSRSPLDRLPTRGEVEAQLKRADALRTSAGFTGAAIARRLEDADAFLESRLGQLHNLSLVHDQTLARIAAAQRQLGDSAPGSAEHRRAGATLARLESRLERIAAEEARRKAAHHARERQRLTTGRDVSTLTNIINAKVRRGSSSSPRPLRLMMRSHLSRPGAGRGAQLSRHGRACSGGAGTHDCAAAGARRGQPLHAPQDRPDSPLPPGGPRCCCSSARRRRPRCSACGCAPGGHWWGGQRSGQPRRRRVGDA